jgi:hypothetical protein
MNLLYRLGFYLVGFSVGLIFLAFILKGKKTSCNYGPNDRVISNISKKAWKTQNNTIATFDSLAFHQFLKKASIDFGKSNTQKDSCRTYFINGYWSNKPISVEIENCEKTIEVLQLLYRSE